MDKNTENDKKKFIQHSLCNVSQKRMGKMITMCNISIRTKRTTRKHIIYYHGFTKYVPKMTHTPTIMTTSLPNHNRRGRVIYSNQWLHKTQPINIHSHDTIIILQLLKHAWYQYNTRIVQSNYLQQRWRPKTEQNCWFWIFKKKHPTQRWLLAFKKTYQNTQEVKNERFLITTR